MQLSYLILKAVFSLLHLSFWNKSDGAKFTSSEMCWAFQHYMSESRFISVVLNSKHTYTLVQVLIWIRGTWANFTYGNCNCFIFIYLFFLYTLLTVFFIVQNDVFLRTYLNVFFTLQYDIISHVHRSKTGASLASVSTVVQSNDPGA